MARDREKQKENKFGTDYKKDYTEGHKEEPLLKCNEYGKKDLTPYNALRSMRGLEIVLK